jgi:hypothetical protein
MTFYSRFLLLLTLTLSLCYSLDVPDTTLRDSNKLVDLLNTNGMNGFIEGVVSSEQFLSGDRAGDIRKIEAVFGDDSGYITTLGGLIDPCSKYIGAVNVSDVIIVQVYSIQLAKGQLLVALSWYKGERNYWLCKFLFGDNAEPYALRLSTSTTK